MTATTTILDLTDRLGLAKCHISTYTSLMQANLPEIKSLHLQSELGALLHAIDLEMAAVDAVAERLMDFAK